MLTLSCVSLTSRRAVRAGAAAAGSLIMVTAICSATYAAGVALGGCIAGAGAANCVARWGEAGDPYIRTVPKPLDEVEQNRAAERDRKWEQHCKPVIAQDRFGVPRYQYAAPGCEFGVLQ
ncbi:MAG TPA: hypothetical protein VHY10_03615 [Xanthobacteraceae bacterium]|nr:hypothetical protein [Xanthobacteraceae bacterium]